MFRATEVPVPMRTAMLWVGEDKSVVLRTFLVYIILMICYIFSGDNDRGFSRMSAVSMLLLFRCAGTSGHVIHVVCACCVTIFGRVGFSCVFCNRIAGITASVNALARQGKNYRFANFSCINVHDADRGFFGYSTTSMFFFLFRCFFFF